MAELLELWDQELKKNNDNNIKLWLIINGKVDNVQKQMDNVKRKMQILGKNKKRNIRDKKH